MSPGGAKMNGQEKRARIAELQAVMALLEDRLEDDIEEVPPRRRPLVANALLNLAVARLLAEEGPARAATILARLASLIAAGRQPAGDQALPLSGADA